MSINEESFYSRISEFLHVFFKCQYSGKRKLLWGRQPDVLGVKFEVKDGLMLHLYLVEVKIIDSLEAAYNLIGEMEARIASFHKRNSIFYSLHPYLGIFEAYNVEEIREYAENRKVGIINIYSNSLLLEKISTPIFSNKVLLIKDLKEQNWIKDDNEAKILKEVIKLIDWQTWNKIADASNLNLYKIGW
jgi:hypothetical protein